MTQALAYTPRELMVVCAARQIQENERVFVGMRLPLLAFALAKRTHAPHCGWIVRDWHYARYSFGGIVVYNG